MGSSTGRNSRNHGRRRKHKSLYQSDGPRNDRGRNRRGRNRRGPSRTRGREASRKDKVKNWIDGRRGAKAQMVAVVHSSGHAAAREATYLYQTGELVPGVTL